MTTSLGQVESQAIVTPPYVAGPLRLLPFRGLMLASARIGDPASGRAFARPYKDVAARLLRWQQHGQISHDDTPALYLHEYTAGGITIRGLVGLLDVSRRATTAQERAILPHEGVYPAQADDLADRMYEMGINPAPILLVHRGKPSLRTLIGNLVAQPPDHDFTDRAKQQHRIWSIVDPQTIKSINRALGSTRALIADGHHRYAAYLRLQQRHPGGAYDSGLVMLVDQDDTPLFLGAIHRSLVGSSLDDVSTAALAAGTELIEMPEEEAVAALSPGAIVVSDSERWGVLATDPSSPLATVEFLHERLIPLLPHGPRRIEYHHTVADALKKARPGRDAAVLLPAPDVDTVLRIANEDRLLPEKATSFQPKTHLGVLLRSLRDE